MMNSNKEWLTLLTGLIYTIIVIILYKNQNKSKDIGIKMMILLSLTSVFAYYNDYWNYEEQLRMISRSPGLTYGWEQVYIWIAEKVSYNYAIWRLTIWGTGAILITLIFKKLELNDVRCWFIFYGTYFWLYAYARSSVAMVLFTFGLILLLSEKSRIGIFTGLLCMGLSIFGHKSLAIALLTVPFMLIKPNKQFFCAAVIFFPIFVRILQYLIDNISLFSIATGNFEYYDIEGFQNDFDRISEYNRFETAGMMRLFLGRLVDISHYLYIIMPTYWICIKNYCKDSSVVVRGTYMASFILFYIGLAFSFCGMGSTVFSYRIINLSVLPAVFTVIFMLKEGCIDFKRISPILYFAISIEILEYFIYQFYVNISN